MLKDRVAPIIKVVTELDVAKDYPYADFLYLAAMLAVTTTVKKNRNAAFQTVSVSVIWCLSVTSHKHVTV